jgi:hypothetical protein
VAQFRDRLRMANVPYHLLLLRPMVKLVELVELLIAYFLLSPILILELMPVVISESLLFI